MFRFFLSTVFVIALAAGMTAHAQDAGNETAGEVSEILDAAYRALQNLEYDVAYDLFYPLASQDVAVAQYEIGMLYHRGAGVEADAAKAAHWYAAAADGGHAESQYRLGNMYLMGEGVRQSDSEAAHWFEKADRQGHAGAGKNLAGIRRIATAKTREDLEREAAALPPPEREEQAASVNEGDRRGFFRRWIKGDEEKNVESPAAAPPAGVTQTAAAADPRPVALTGSGAVSNYELGMAYALGNTLEQDHTKAFEHFTLSAQEGYAPAQYWLGMAYANGDGTEQDPARAIEWYEKSAAQGYAIARRSLASIYLDGQDGIAPNRPLALAWYNLLAEQGNRMDIHRRDTLLQELSEQEISEAGELTAGIRKRLEAEQE